LKLRVYTLWLKLGRHDASEGLQDLTAGFGIRGMGIDRNGVAWMPLDSGHIGSFDRGKVPGAAQRTGCGEGRETPRGLYLLSAPGDPVIRAIPAPKKTPTTSGSTSTTYWGSAAMYRSLPNQSDSLHALVGGGIVELRMPYLMGFFAKGIDRRIDDPAGRAAVSGSPQATARRSTSKASTPPPQARPARPRRPCRARWSCSSSSVPTRSPIKSMTITD
jgi:hypothetical protein